MKPIQGELMTMRAELAAAHAVLHGHSGYQDSAALQDVGHLIRDVAERIDGVQDWLQARGTVPKLVRQAA